MLVFWGIVLLGQRPQGYPRHNNNNNNSTNHYPGNHPLYHPYSILFQISVITLPFNQHFKEGMRYKRCAPNDPPTSVLLLNPPSPILDTPQPSISPTPYPTRSTSRSIWLFSRKLWFFTFFFVCFLEFCLYSSLLYLATKA